MRAVGVAGPGDPVILDDVEPDPQPGQALVRTVWSGISAGTEVALVRGTDPHHQVAWDRELRAFRTGEPPGSDGTGYPVRGLGYMEVARVVESRSADLPEGGWVAAAYGHRTARTVALGTDRTVRLPADLDPLLGVYVAQLGPIAANGVLHADAELAGPAAAARELGAGVRGARVLVTGAGAIGLLVGLFACEAGAAEVVVAEPDPARRARAARLGLATVDDTDDAPAWLAVKERWAHGTGDHGADVALQCRASDAALATALKALRPQGTVVDLAFYPGGAERVRLGEEFHHNGLALRCAQIGRLPRGLGDAWDAARLSAATVDLLRSRGDDVRRELVGDVVPFATAPAVLRELADRARPADRTVVLDFSSE